MYSLDQLVRSGKVRYIGGSTMPAYKFSQMILIADWKGYSRPIAMQNHYNLVYREEEREMIPFCVDQGVGMVPWSPLARGFLAGNRTREGSAVTDRGATDTWAHDAYCLESDFDVAEAVRQVAQERGVSPAQIALAWVLNKPYVTAPIVGATKPHHLEEALAAMEIKLTPNEIARLEQYYRPHPVAGPM
jgi:aryl-alcohol dehydrogenase (NADP+)